MKDDNRYRVSLIIGKDKAMAAYLPHGGQGEVMDRTGGYGSLATPLTLLWLRHEGQFIIDDGLLDMSPEEGMVIDGLLERCLEERSLNVDGRVYDGFELLAIYTKLLLATLKEINPKSELESIHLMFEETLPMPLVKGIAEKIKCAQETEVILSDPDRLGNRLMDLMRPGRRDSCLWLDLTEDNMILRHCDAGGDCRVIFSESLGLKSLQTGFINRLSEEYLTFSARDGLSLKDKRQIEALAKGHLQSLFIRAREGKGLKVTFNHVFPPFQVKMTGEDLEAMTFGVTESLSRLCEKTGAQWPGLPVLVTGEILRHQWVGAIIEAELGKQAILSWRAKLFALLYAMPEKEDNSEIIERDVALLTEGGDQPLVIAKAGTAAKGFRACVDLVLTAHAPVVRLHEKDSEGRWHCVLEEEVAPVQGDMSLIRAEFSLTDKGQWTMETTQLPL